MPEFDEKSLAAQLKDGIQRLYFLCGDDNYLVRHYCGMIVKKAVTGEPDMNLHLFDNGASADDIVFAANSVPMLSDRQAVVVTDYNFSSLSEYDFKKFETLFSDPSPYCVLIFRYDNFDLLSKMKESKSKNDKNKLLTALVKQNGCFAVLSHRSESELVQMLCRLAAKRGVNMQPTVAREIIARTSNDINVLTREVEKLCDYVGSGNAVNIGDIDDMIVKTSEESIYKLASSVCSGDANTAFSVLESLIAHREAPEYIISVLSSAFIDIYRVKAAQADNYTVADIDKRFGYGAKRLFLLERANTASRRMTTASVRRMLALISDADNEIKSTSLDKAVILETTVAKLLSEARR